jgi:hypothetical protein
MYISSCAGVISSFVEVASLIEDLRLDVVIRCLSSGTDREGHDAGGGAISNRGGLTPEGLPRGALPATPLSRPIGGRAFPFGVTHTLE